MAPCGVCVVLPYTGTIDCIDIQYRKDANHAPHRCGKECRGGPRSAGRYQRHRPEQTLLYRIVEQHYPAFTAHLAGQGSPEEKSRSKRTQPVARKPGTTWRSIWLTYPSFHRMLLPAGRGRVSVGLPAGKGHKVALMGEDISKTRVERGGILGWWRGAWSFATRELTVDPRGKGRLCFLYPPILNDLLKGLYTGAILGTT